MTRSIISVAALMAAFAGPALAQQGKPGAHFIENWDMDGDGQVTLAEAETKRDEIFYMFDQDENDVLDATEYVLFDETRRADMDTNAGGHKKGPMKAVDAGMKLEFNDTDGDGAVSKAEFLARTADWFAMVDRTGDALITGDDFGSKSN